MFGVGARLLEEGLGGVCLFGSNLTGSLADTAELVAAVRAAGPVALVATDEEGGDVTRLHSGDASPVPGPAVLGAVDDPALTRAVLKPFTLRTEATLEPGYSVDYEMRLRNLSARCQCVPKVEVVSARAPRE